ncbi:hypothetical protein [Planomonospora alba]
MTGAGQQPDDCLPEQVLPGAGEIGSVPDPGPYEVPYDVQGVGGLERPRALGRDGAAPKKPRKRPRRSDGVLPGRHGPGGVVRRPPAPAPVPTLVWPWPVPSFAWPTPSRQPPVSWPTPRVRMPEAEPSPVASQQPQGAPLPLQLNNRSREIEIVREREPQVEVRGLPAAAVAIGGLLCLLWLQAKVQQKRADRAMSR